MPVAALAALGAPIEACLATAEGASGGDGADRRASTSASRSSSARPCAAGPSTRTGLAAGRGDVLLVGHEPDFSDELARLTGARAKLKKGGLAIVDPGELKALLRPLDLAAIAATG